MTMRKLQLILFILVPIVNFVPIAFLDSAFEDDPTVLIQPADYAFGIWGPIFLGMIIYSIFQVNKARTDSIHLRNATRAGILAALASITFVPISYSGLQWLGLINILWHLSALIWLFIALKAQLGIEQNKYTRWFYLPTQLYLGWICAATAVSVALFLRGTVGWSFPEPIEISIAIAVIAALAGVGIFMASKRGGIVALVIIWALIALIAENGNYDPIFYACVGAIALISIPLLVFGTKKRLF